MKRDGSDDDFGVVIEVRTCTVDDVGASPAHLRFLPHRPAAPSSGGEKRSAVVTRDVAGVVVKVGRSVTRFRPGDEVAAVLPLSHGYRPPASGGEWPSLCEVSEMAAVVGKPGQVSWELAACCLSDGLRAYTALHYLARLRPRDSILICNAASSFGIACVQLAVCWGARVIVSVADEDEAQLMRALSLDGVARISPGHRYLRQLVVDETGGLGVDVVLDCEGVIDGNEAATGEENGSGGGGEGDWRKPSKHEVLVSMAVMGRWVTSHPRLQLDPPDSELMRLKCATLCHLFHDSLLLSTYHQHRVLHVLKDVLDKAANSHLRPHLMSVLPATDLSPSLFPTPNRIVLRL